MRQEKHRPLRCALTFAAAFLALAPLPAGAQSFDCARAQDGVDRAICASPRLRQLDSDLGQAFAAALARDPTQADAVRGAERAWARGRASCLAGAAETCLEQSYAARIAALVAPVPVPAPAPLAAATLERATIPTAGATDILLHVTVPGRFAIRAESASGTALTLVDMLTGPGERAGVPGRADGRIDALLDVGTYKLRARGDAKATGETRLTVTPFTEAAPPLPAPFYQPLEARLADLQLASFWLVVGAAERSVRVEAAGRSLGALKVWRDGRDLVALAESATTIAPIPAHPMTDIVLDGALSPGTYLVTAYGGPALPWADGAPDQPLLLRTGRSPDLLAGGAAGQVGPFAREVFSVPPDAAQALLILPAPATAHLRTLAGDAETDSADLTPAQREPTALLDLGDPKSERSVELQAAPGQKFALRPVPAAETMPARPGRYWFAASSFANGGDEAPAAAILARIPKNAVGSVVASAGVPQVGPTKAWRTRFNLRGDTRLLFRATAAVTLAARADGPPVEPRITTLQGAVMNATGGGRAATRWALSPGWYALVLTAKPESLGILDLTLGPENLIPPTPEAAGPAAPVLPLGEQNVEKDSELALVTNGVPDAVGGLVARPAPVEITSGPLVATLAAGEGRSLDLHVAKPGVLVVRDVGGGAAIERRAVALGTSSVALPPADHARTVAVAWLPPPAPATPHPAPPPDLATLHDGAPVFANLRRDGQASYFLEVAQGGLFRVETLGRLQTEGRIGTAFIPDLGDAAANGIGSNMLLQRYLRAGRYRLDVTARASAGRLGLLAVAARLDQGATLQPGGSVRASLAADSGVAFPLHIGTAGRYRLDLLGDGRVFAARLEDAQGWPLLAAADLASIEQTFEAGDYRLIVPPQGVAARAVARLRRIETPTPPEGHGPHPLPFDAAQTALWREPAARDAPRTPDTWQFSLAGPAEITVRLEGDGMAATLRGNGEALARMLAGTPLTKTLPAGEYRIEAASLGRNDRLGYTIALTSKELQPGVPRTLTLPAEVAFSIAAPRVASLTSFGGVPVRATLRDAAGEVLARASGRTDDWNIALSRPLPAGRYRLTVAPLRPPEGGVAPPASADDATPAEDTSAADQQQPADQAAPADQPDADAPQPLQTELTLALPPDAGATALASDGTATLAGAGVQHVALPAGDGLIVVAAESQAELILAVERREADGRWRSLGQAQGAAPLLALPSGPDRGDWRASVWAVDGGAWPIRLAARAVAAPAQVLGTVRLAPLDLPGLAEGWRVGRLADPDAAMLRLAAPVAGLRAASRPEEPAAPVAGTAIVAQSDQVWLLAPDAAEIGVAPEKATGDLAIAVPAGGRATLALAAGSPCAFVASSGLGQPGLDAGRGMGVAQGSAFALCGGPRLAAWNAGGTGALRLRLRRLDLTLLPAQPADLAFSGLLPAHAALKLRLPAGTKRLDASLAAGGALIADTLTAWSGDAPLSRSLVGAWTEVLLVNTADAPAPAALAVTPVQEAPALDAQHVLRRFFGAAGSFVLPVAAAPGQHLVLAGAAHARVQRRDGQVREGTDLTLDGAASAVVTHGTGPLAAWLEGGGASPWPATPAEDVTLPQRLPLAAEAMALRLSPGAPALLHLRTTAPVILAFGGAPTLFASGAVLDRYLPAGETVLRLLSPQDGELSGTLDLSATPVAEVAEGLGAPVAVAPGGAAVFGFTVTAEGPVGLGVRADPDRVTVRLLDEGGRVLDTGVTMLHRLRPGHYLLEASVPADAPTTLLRPAVLGIAPHKTPPPPELVRRLLIAAGFAPPGAAP